jgi:enoyl-CoA hydratase/carnithine racemase
LNDLILVDRLPLEAADACLAVVTLNRSESKNPLDWATVRELGLAFDELAADDHVRVVAVTGAGDTFSAGGDMEKYLALQSDARQFPRFLADLHEVFGRIAQYPKPYLSLVNGLAIAGGLELMLSCDLVFASTDARIGDGHLTYGQMGGGGVLTLLPRAVGPMRARELILSGRLLTAAEALDWGLVSQVLEPDDLLSAAREFASIVARRSPLAVANAKQTLNAAFYEGTATPAGLRLEREITARYCLTSADAREGLAAFAEKRTPSFTGR